MKQHVFGVVLVVALAGGISPAEALQDPTRPPGSSGRSVKAEPLRALELGSIVHGPDRRVAVIDGVALREGQSHNGIRVRHIHRNRVEIMDRGQRRVLYPASLPQVRRTQ